MAIAADTLLAESQCYLCLGISQAEALELALLNRIAGGSSPSSGGGGYTIPLVQPSAGSPVASTTYYVGGDVSAVGNAWTTSGIFYQFYNVVVPTAGTVTKLWLRTRIRLVLATAGNVTHDVLVNGTTGHGSVVYPYTATSQEGSDFTLNAAVAQGDTLALRLVTPAWATPPTGVTIFGLIYIQT